MREMAQALQGAESRVKFLTEKANQSILILYKRILVALKKSISKR